MLFRSPYNMQVKNIIKIILLSTLCTFYLNSKSQVSKGYSKCEAMHRFLNSPIVDSNFNNSYLKKVDSFILIDLDSSLTKCPILHWRNKPVSIVTSGTLFDSVKRFNFYYVVNGRNNIYRFATSDNDGLDGHFFIQCGRNNVLSTGYFGIKKGRYFTNRIENGVE